MTKYDLSQCEKVCSNFRQGEITSSRGATIWSGHLYQHDNPRLGDMIVHNGVMEQVLHEACYHVDIQAVSQHPVTLLQCCSWRKGELFWEAHQIGHFARCEVS